MLEESSSSSSGQRVTQKPVKVTNVYDATQLKNALDDQLAKCLRNECRYHQSHRHTDRKLILGYISVLNATGSFLYEQEYGFHATKWISLLCVIVFWVLQAASFCYSRWVEENQVFTGCLYFAEKRIGTLIVTTTMQPRSSNYQITFSLMNLRSQKQMRLETTESVAQWFTQDGILVVSKFDDFIKTLAKTVASKSRMD